MFLTTILVASLAAQIAVVVLAVRLVPVEGQRLARGILVAALAIMAIRRGITLYYVMSGQPAAELTATSEFLGLFVSLALLVGVAWLGPMLQATREAEEAVRASEEKLRSAQRVGQFGHWNYEFGTDRLEWSDDVLKLFGVGPNDPALTFERYIEILHPEDVPLLQKAFEEAGQGDARYDYVTRVITPEGDIRYLRIIGEVVYDEQGHPVRAHGTSQEVSGQQRREQELARYQRIIADSLNEIYLFDADSLKFIYVNHEAARNLGYSLDEFSSMSPLDIEPQFDSESFARLTAPLFRGEEQQIVYETVHQRRDGSRYDVEVHLQRLRYAEEDICVALVQDITEQKHAEGERARLEAQVRRAQKFESLGTMAGGIAHDFNNILTPILGFAGLEMRRLEPSDPLYERFEQISVAARRAKELVEQILLFSKRIEKERVPLRLDRSIEQALKLLRPSIPATVNIHWSSDHSAVVLADETQIQQVILNLCTNAWQAMEEQGGDLYISVEESAAGSELPCLEADLAEGHDYVCLCVRDTGPGIHKAALEQIFEPFFTTRDTDGGSGLGLSVVHGIVQSYGGDIAVSSRPGEGTTFSVYLPAYHGDVEESPRKPVVVSGGDERILAVDDDPAICFLLDQMLSSLGYRVSAFESSPDALEAFRARPGEYDMMITDLSMPAMTGVELAGEVHAIQPELPIMILTGYPDHTVSPDARQAVGVRKVLVKPVSIDTLTGAVREVLDEAQEQRDGS